MEQFNIDIFNEELKQFFNNIIDTITYFVDVEEQSTTINFNYNNTSFNLYKDDENNKLSISSNYYYEFYCDNYEEILINKCEFKTVNINEMADFLEKLFLFIINI